MSDKLRDAAQAAVDLLKDDDRDIYIAIRVLEAALAEPAIKESLTVAEQEPVAWMSDSDVGFYKEEFGNYPCVPLYTAPQRREWVGLTVEEIAACCMESTTTQLSFYNAIEAKLKEKNGG